MLNADRLELAFFQKLSGLKASDELLNSWVASEAMESAAGLTAELTELNRGLEADRIDKEKARIWELAMANDSLPRGELQQQLERMALSEERRRIRVLEIQRLIEAASNRERTIDSARSLLNDFRLVFDAASYEEKREMCLAISETLGGLTASREGLEWVRETGVQPPAPRRRG